MTPSLPRKCSTTELRGHILPSHATELGISIRSSDLLELERETGLEPATDSLEGYYSTTELLPLGTTRHNFPNS